MNYSSSVFNKKALPEPFYQLSDVVHLTTTGGLNAGSTYTLSSPATQTMSFNAMDFNN